MQYNILPTERLFLREMNPNVYQHVFETFSDEELIRFFGLQNEQDLQTKKSNHSKGFTMFNKSFVYFQLLLKENEENIGWCGFHTWYTQHNRAEIGYTLNSELHRNKGYMKEALLPILHYGFEQMKLHRIEAFVGPDNIPSLKLLKQSGFIQEGVLREHYFKNNRFEDSVMLSLLQKEFV